MTQPEPETGRRVDRLDGNAAGGALSEIFGLDLTAALIECRHCGRSGALAEAVVELDPDGLVIICRGCRHQLLAYVWGERRVLRFPGLAGLELPAGE
ncbi:MAG TPA: DUF6510 family protein [Microlunatus sp.]|nr:DUF6510 family protein [Microlunatus sp.]